MLQEDAPEVKRIKLSHEEPMEVEIEANPRLPCDQEHSQNESYENIKIESHLITLVKGKTYYLYRWKNGQTYISLLSPEDWKGKPPYEYIAPYRYDSAQKWTKMNL